MTSSDSNRPGAGQGRRDEGGSADTRSAPSQPGISRPQPARAKDDVSSAPESGDKPEASMDDGDLAPQARPAQPGGHRPAPIRDRDDVSSAPESGDKPEASTD